jgi:hypothetical protein
MFCIQVTVVIRGGANLTRVAALTVTGGMLVVSFLTRGFSCVLHQEQKRNSLRQTQFHTAELQMNDRGFGGPTRDELKQELLDAREELNKKDEEIRVLRGSGQYDTPLPPPVDGANAVDDPLPPPPVNHAPGGNAEDGPLPPPDDYGETLPPPPVDAGWIASKGKDGKQYYYNVRSELQA